MSNEYLTSEDLGYKPDVVQKAKFEYSPIGKVFNKGLDKSDKKEGLLKRLRNIEGKNEQQLLVIRDQGEIQLEAIKDQGERQLEAISNYDATNKLQKIEFDSNKNQEAKNIDDEVEEMSRKIKTKSLYAFIQVEDHMILIVLET